MSTIDNTPAIISFGAAGVLYIGEDAEVRHGCAAMMAAINGFWTKRYYPPVEQYEAACLTVECRAKATAPIPATSRAGIVAKAEVVQRLSDLGMAGYAARIMASSLARTCSESGARNNDDPPVPRGRRPAAEQTAGVPLQAASEPPAPPQTKARQCPLTAAPRRARCRSTCNTVRISDSWPRSGKSSPRSPLVSRDRIAPSIEWQAASR
jgi:hypothetical protein